MTQTRPKTSREHLDWIEIFYLYNVLFYLILSIIFQLFQLHFYSKSDGIQEVSGSIPLISTKTTNRKVKNLAVLSYLEVLMHPTPIK